MNLDAVRSFLYVPETGSFSLAAPRLKVMQSTISGRIQSLEEDLGCRPIYLVYPSQSRDSTLLTVALSGLRQIAATPDERRP